MTLNEIHRGVRGVEQSCHFLEEVICMHIIRSGSMSLLT